MKSAVLRGSLLLAAALGTGSVFAETVYMYKSTMPDGRIIFGDFPAKGAKKVDRWSVDISKTGVVPVRAKTAAQIEKAAEKRSTALDDAFAEYRSAEQGYRDALAAQIEGTEVEEYEAIGIVGPRGGPVRRNENYWIRQKELADAVADARERLDRARATLDALR